MEFQGVFKLAFYFTLWIFKQKKKVYIVKF